MTENDFLRLTMVLKDSSATTLDRYIGKLAEAILTASEKTSLTLGEICEQINSQFALTFDTNEIKNALNKRKTGRIFLDGNTYKISTKVREQLSAEIDPLDLLKHYIAEYEKISNKSFDKEIMLENLLKYLYHCFNSTAKNLITLLQKKIVLEYDISSFSNDEVLLVNDFIAWNYKPKNELFYKIINASYYYCMLTTKQDKMLSRKIFQGKRFFLDSNIIFRMSGINKEERKYTADVFIKKCSDVGIALCYTNETLGELHRVINAHIKYIILLTQGQAPVSSYHIQRMGNNVDSNDFYDIYYRWTQKTGNNFSDFEAFQKYLIGLVNDSLSALTLVNISNYALSSSGDSFSNSCRSLESFKNSKRPAKQITIESLETDINNVFHALSVRKRSQSNTLWQTNDFIVSADQLLIAWTEQTYPGIPLVVLPSTWLSILLRFTGRSEDDYKSYCLFMSLRQHQTSSDELSINPIQVMTELSKKTTDATIKEKIITELITNTNTYDFTNNDSYSSSVEKAFDVVLSELRVESKQQIAETTNNLRNEFLQDRAILERQLETLSSEHEYITKYAQNKASQKVDFYRRIMFLQPILPFVGIGVLMIAVFAYVCRWSFMYELSNRLGPFITVVATIVMTALPAAMSGLLKHLSSEERRTNLVRKYSLETERRMKYK